MLLVPWALIGGVRYPDSTPRSALLVLAVAALAGLTIQRLVGEMRAARDFSAAILDTAGSLVVVTDADARIERFNRTAEQVSGFTADAMVGRSLIDALMPPESSATIRAELAAARPADFPRSYEHELVTADGGRRLVAWTVTCLLDDSGAIGHLIATGTDITEQRRAAEALRISTDRLEGILEHTTTRIAVKDRGGRYLLVNRAWKTSAGCDGTGRTDAELFAPEIAERARRMDERGVGRAAQRDRVRARSGGHDRAGGQVPAARRRR